MDISTAPSLEVHPRFSYASLIQDILSAAPNWYPIELERISGISLQTKQNRIWQAALNRGIHIQTTRRDGYIYARVAAVKQ